MKTTLPNTGLPIGAIPHDVLVCGDPERTALISNRFDDPSLLSDKREYRCMVGHYRGMPVAVCSHGVGAPGAGIAFEELIQAGARRIIRIGTCGALQPGLKSGYLVIAAAAVQNIGYAKEVVPPGYPAVADLDLTIALRNKAQEISARYGLGLVLTRDAFYQGVDVIQRPDYQIMSNAHILAVEMECAALFIVGSLRQIQCGAILTADGNVLERDESFETYEPDQQRVKDSLSKATDIALQAIHSLNDDTE